MSHVHCRRAPSWPWPRHKDSPPSPGRRGPAGRSARELRATWPRLDRAAAAPPRFPGPLTFRPRRRAATPPARGLSGALGTVLATSQPRAAACAASPASQAGRTRSRWAASTTAAPMRDPSVSAAQCADDRCIGDDRSIGTAQRAHRCAESMVGIPNGAWLRRGAARGARVPVGLRPTGPSKGR